MMGRQTGRLFYLFNLERRIPAGHLLRRINPVVTRILVELREQLTSFYSDIGRPSIDPELMIRMLIIGYCYGIRFERRLCEEVEMHIAYRWFCRLNLDDTPWPEVLRVPIPEVAVRAVIEQVQKAFVSHHRSAVREMTRSDSSAPSDIRFSKSSSMRPI